MSFRSFLRRTSRATSRLASSYLSSLACAQGRANRQQCQARLWFSAAVPRLDLGEVLARGDHSVEGDAVEDLHGVDALRFVPLEGVVDVVLLHHGLERGVHLVADGDLDAGVSRVVACFPFWAVLLVSVLDAFDLEDAGVLTFLRLLLDRSRQGRELEKGVRHRARSVC